MNKQIKIGIIGEFDPALKYHAATNDALDHAADHLNIKLDKSWISTGDVSDDSADRQLNDLNGILSAPGDYKIIAGALSAIQFARMKNKPFFGT